MPKAKPKAPAPKRGGVKLLGVAVDDRIAAQFVEFCRGRGETQRHHLELAILRHLRQPPPPPETADGRPPLPEPPAYYPPATP